MLRSLSSVGYICASKCGLPVKPQLGSIIVHGAEEHNLKKTCFMFPKNSFVALTGLSGSGKSSIAFGILGQECVRQYLDSLGMTTDHVPKAKVGATLGLSPSICISQRVSDFNSRSTVGTKTGVLAILRNLYAAMGHQPCVSCGTVVKQPLQNKHKLTIVETKDANADATAKKKKKSYFDCPHCSEKLEKLKMEHFSYNTTAGACGDCKGQGQIVAADIRNLLDEKKTINNGGVKIWDSKLAEYKKNIIIAASRYYQFPFDATQPIGSYTQKQKDFLLYGITGPNFIKQYKNIKVPKKVSDGKYEGIIPSLIAQYKSALEKPSPFIVHKPCPTCNGTRLGKLGRTVTIAGKTIIDVLGFNLNEFFTWTQALDERVSQDELPILGSFSNALQERTSHIIEVGLGYLTLDRTLPSLSVGESQRLRLANVLGSGLTGVLYVLDEPTTGLHPHDTAKLLKTMKMIKEMGNTVLVIEHDLDVIREADHIIDVGPGRGSAGGKIVISGTPAEVMACPASITGQYLAKKTKIKLNAPRIQDDKKAIIVRGASEHNLRNIDVTIPLNKLVVMTGVSGSGKSTFLFDILDKIARMHLNNASEIPGKYTAVEGLQHINRVVTVDQVTIGKTKSSRSNVATYTKCFDLIRDLFAALPAAKKSGYSANSFSFNISDERCNNCNGAGRVEVDLAFMPEIEVECPSCNGGRFNENLLAVKYKGHNIADILQMTVGDSISIFNENKKIYSLLNLMIRVGLEHLTLGQSTSTLSGGEAQRIKLASELSKSGTKNTLYLLDEPTTGLHSYEIEKLLAILRELIAKGNTVIVIEHNLDVICQADTIIDFGPGGGVAGGRIVATGTPQEIAANKASLTGQCLQAYLVGKSALTVEELNNDKYEIKNDEDNDSKEEKRIKNNDGNDQKDDKREKHSNQVHVGINRQMVKLFSPQAPILSTLSTSSSHVALYTSEDKYAEQITSILSTNFTIGSALSRGDCFFDSIAQGIVKAGILIPGDEQHENYKKIRILCNNYLKQSTAPDKNWPKALMDKDANTGGQDFQTCLATSQYTQLEMERLKVNSLFNGLSTWGRPHIEGRIICEIFGVQLHILELSDLNNKLIIEHTLVNALESKQVGKEKVDLRSPKIIHIALYRNHYVPIFNKLQELYLTSAPKRDSIESLRTTSLFSLSQELKTDPTESHSQATLFLSSRKRQIDTVLNEENDIDPNGTTKCARSSTQNSVVSQKQK